MKRAITAWLTVAALLGPTPVTQAQEPPQLEQAMQLESQGRLKEALQAYEQILGAPQAISPEKEGELRLKTARLRAEVNPQATELTVADLQRAAKLGTPKLQRTALNGLGVQLLQARRPKESIEVLEELERQAQSAPGLSVQERAVYAFNLGRALEVDGQLQAAFHKYGSAVSAVPSFDSAIDRAIDTLIAQKPAPLPQAQALLSGLAIPNPRASRSGVRRLLVAWKNEPGAARLLPILGRALASQGVTRETFEAEDWPILSSLDVETVPFRQMLIELRQVLRGDLDTTNLANLGDAFQAWKRSGEEGAAFRGLLFHAARAADTSGRERSAILLYAIALDRDWQDLEAAARLAEVLQAHPQEVDRLMHAPPRGAERYDKWLQSVIERLFVMKGMAYEAGDKEAALRLHLVLGAIFARTPNARDPSDPRSAIFQFQHALAVEQQLRAQDPQRPPAPGLYVGLADAYAARASPAKAWPEYLTAAELFLVQGNQLEASRVMESCKKLPPPAKRESQARMEAVERRMAAIPGPEKACQGKMVDIRADPLNCGNCGVVCANGSGCQNGSCVH